MVRSFYIIRLISWFQQKLSSYPIMLLKAGTTVTLESLFYWYILIMSLFPQRKRCWATGLEGFHHLLPLQLYKIRFWWRDILGDLEIVPFHQRISTRFQTKISRKDQEKYTINDSISCEGVTVIGLKIEITIRNCDEENNEEIVCQFQSCNAMNEDLWHHCCSGILQSLREISLRISLRKPSVESLMNFLEKRQLWYDP